MFFVFFRGGCRWLGCFLGIREIGGRFLGVLSGFWGRIGGIVSCEILRGGLECNGCRLIFHGSSERRVTSLSSGWIGSFEKCKKKK